jgi:hypothetical protein
MLLPFHRYSLLILLATLSVVPGAAAQARSTAPMMLVVDESQAGRRIAFVHEEIPVQPGVLELVYPKWIPGEHGPTGPVEEFAAVEVHSGDASLPWTRDPEDINTIRVTVPAAPRAFPSTSTR